MSDRSRPVSAGPGGSGRVYGGKTAVERRLERRARLVRAGVDIFGTSGYAGATIRAICHEAGLIERYFYESFEDLPGLLETVVDLAFESTVDELTAAVERDFPSLAKRLEHTLSAVLAQLESDLPLARLLLFPQLGVSERLDRRYREGVAQLTRLVENGIEWSAPGALAARDLDPRVLAMGFELDDPRRRQPIEAGEPRRSPRPETGGHRVRSELELRRDGDVEAPGEHRADLQQSLEPSSWDGSKARPDSTVEDARDGLERRSG